MANCVNCLPVESNNHVNCLPVECNTCRNCLTVENNTCGNCLIVESNNCDKLSHVINENDTLRYGFGNNGLNNTIIGTEKSSDQVHKKKGRPIKKKGFRGTSNLTKLNKNEKICKGDDKLENIDVQQKNVETCKLKTIDIDKPADKSGKATIFSKENNEIRGKAVKTHL